MSQINNLYPQYFNSKEFIFNIVNSRSGIVDAALSLSDKGYIQRKLAILVNNIKVKYNGRIIDTIVEIENNFILKSIKDSAK
ncbi:hypothetical protein QKC54_gp0912 [Megavirus baoshan]|uniref:RNA polymerase Rpb1 domain-containing protein n=1 Tax=Megavirus baoshan TaxID=2496520 RepID=A0A8K1W9C4_9VIRU|nr:hypothetical protein QKC54_gp0912 [Megavirus baoshan]UFX99746.1 hypothetical protein Mb0160 [Megavirus baoshan]